MECSINRNRFGFTITALLCFAPLQLQSSPTEADKNYADAVEKMSTKLQSIDSTPIKSKEFDKLRALYLSSSNHTKEGSAMVDMLAGKYDAAQAANKSIFEVTSPEEIEAVFDRDFALLESHLLAISFYKKQPVSNESAIAFHSKMANGLCDAMWRTSKKYSFKNKKGAVLGLQTLTVDDEYGLLACKEMKPVEVELGKVGKIWIDALSAQASDGKTPITILFDIRSFYPGELPATARAMAHMASHAGTYMVTGEEHTIPATIMVPSDQPDSGVVMYPSP